MQSIEDILDTPFFKHLFFDAYVLKSDGYSPDRKSIKNY